MDSRKRSIISNDDDMSPLYKEWDEASCPICMDHPHNAVLLICSSHDKGCRSYICDTSYRHSNCFDRFKKLKEEENSGASLTPGSPHPHLSINFSSVDSDLSGRLDFGEVSIHNKLEEGMNLKCPLCRGSVLGWEVVEKVRKYLNLKPRSCSRESCSFSGNYQNLRRHARRVHPTVRPADIDPSRQRAWRRLEDQREYNDIVSAIHSAVPGSVVVGDYMIESGERITSERDRGGEGGGRWLSTLVLLEMIGSLDGGAGGRREVRGGWSRGLQRDRRGGGSFHRQRYLWGENLLGLQDEDEEDEDEDEDDGDDHEVDLNVLSDIGPPRRRRRITRSWSDDEDRQ
ncbi:hypothetical protein OROGR_027477 [Orobanche gracilis]